MHGHIEPEPTPPFSRACRGIAGVTAGNGWHLHRASSDCLSSIAESHHFANSRAIYAFRSLRVNPDMIFPGDEIYIPDLVGKDHAGTTNKRYEFVRKRQPAFLRFVAEAGRGGL